MTRSTCFLEPTPVQPVNFIADRIRKIHPVCIGRLHSALPLAHAHLDQIDHLNTLKIQEGDVKVATSLRTQTQESKPYVQTRSSRSLGLSNLTSAILKSPDPAAFNHKPNSG